MEPAFNTPLRECPLSVHRRLFGSPMSTASVHSPPVQDRFISSRATQDNSMSCFLLTTKENVTPMKWLAHQSPQREESVASSFAIPSSPLRQPLQSPAHSPPGSALRGSSLGREGSPPPSDVYSKLNLEASGMGNISGVAGGRGGSLPVCEPTSLSQYNSPMDIEPYTSKLVRTLFSAAPQTTVLGLHSQATAAAARNGEGPETQREADRYGNSLGVVFECNRARNFTSKNFRIIAKTPERILDAADIIDDFYLNLIDWSLRDTLAVALQTSVYLWDAATCNITQLPLSHPSDSPSSIVCGLNWSPDGRQLALGLNDGSVELWDADAQQMVRRTFHHSGRVGSLTWTGNVLATGSKDATIRLQDMRAPSNTDNVLHAHQQEVCGLKWSPNGVHLASGGNDNQLLIWDRRLIGTSGSVASLSTGAPTTTPILYLNQHTAAVKALAWNPVQTSLLASGGGTEDKSLRFWNTLTGGCVHCVDTQSQVCGLLWAHSGTELVSSHGFSKNQLTIWKYPALRRVADLTGHTSRVLHLCMSANGEVVVSAAGDETIRFWRCFPPREINTLSRIRHSTSHSAWAAPTTQGAGLLLDSFMHRGAAGPLGIEHNVTDYDYSKRASSAAPTYNSTPMFGDELALR